MRRIVFRGILYAAILVFIPTIASATCPTFHTLTNGTPADASQVMDNYDYILQCPNFTGNVGIGTSSPAGPLHVVGQGIFDRTSHQIALFNGTGGALGSLEAIVSHSTGGALLFSPANTSGVYTERVRIDDAGNVGIGTSAPNALLTLYASKPYIYLDSSNGTAADSEIVIQRGGANKWAFGTQVGDGSENFQLYNYNTSSVDLSVNQGSGNVGIGTTSPAYPLDVVGDMRTSQCLHYNNSTTGTCSSDARIKRDIAPYTAIGLEQIAGLRPMTFYYNGLAGNPDDGVQQIGLIAQDVQRVAPQMVGTRQVMLHATDKHATTIMTVNYSALTYGLINAVRELKARNDDYAVELKSLRAQVAALRQEADARQRRRRYAQN